MIYEINIYVWDLETEDFEEFKHIKLIPCGDEDEIFLTIEEIMHENNLKFSSVDEPITYEKNYCFVWTERSSQ